MYIKIDVDDTVPKWSLIEALLVLGTIFAIDWLLPFHKMKWFSNLSELISPNNTFLGEIFLSVVIKGAFFFIFIGLIIKLGYHLSWAGVGLRRGQGEGWLTMGISQGILLFFTVTIVGTIISWFFPIEVELQNVTEILSTAQNGYERVLCVLIAAVIAPVSEELYFRGFLYPAVKKIIGKIPAVILTSASFGVLHFDIIRFIPIMLGGVWLNMLYIRTESLYTSMIAHSVWNFLMVFMLFWAQSAGAV
ncbi:MAG: CPBP family intramembrane metalloprotease [Clostridia bacterium]|nr:CPBP family intramembrane metalloprotease [Clostridia bacterium]MDD4048400.1 CPBP family intramembrane metalloprotease [Clostridia bacterium]